MRAASLFLAGLLLLAGCSGPEEAPDETGDTPHPPAPASSLPPTGDGGTLLNGTAPGSHRVVFHQEGFMGNEAQTKVAGPGDGATYNWTMPFPVGPEATAIVVELAWDDPLADLDPALDSPHICEVPVEDLPVCLANAFFGDPSGTGTWRNDGGVPGMGDSPAAIRVPAEEFGPFGCSSPCDFSLLAWAKASAGTAIHLYATVFYGEPAPDGYSAIAP